MAPRSSKKAPKKRRPSTAEPEAEAMDAKIADLEKRLEAAEARAEDLARRLAEKEEQELLRMVTG
jgi:predicted RNase H-like nuclease (RuvC/YqgF family)